MAEILVEAKREALDQVLRFVDEYLEEAGCEKQIQLQVDIAVEEIFVNIANYAYREKRGEAVVKLEIKGAQIVLQFMDHGRPYNPLQREDPDVMLSAEDRTIGGLGIYLVKQSMDQVEYDHDGTQNILTIKKKLS